MGIDDERAALLQSPAHTNWIRLPGDPAPSPELRDDVVKLAADGGADVLFLDPPRTTPNHFDQTTKA